MARAPASGADRLSALIAEIEAEAYARGRDDARKELLDLLGAGPGKSADAGRARAGAAAPKRRARGGRRAPRGSVPRFVAQALGEAPGQTPAEILARASSDEERRIKLPSIRTELGNGRKQGKYELTGGRWFLAASTAGDAEPSPSAEAPPAAAAQEPPPQVAGEAASTEASTGPETGQGADG